MAKEEVNYQEVYTSTNYAARPRIFVSSVRIMELITM